MTTSLFKTLTPSPFFDTFSVTANLVGMTMTVERDGAFTYEYKSLHDGRIYTRVMMDINGAIYVKTLTEVVPLKDVDTFITHLKLSMVEEYYGVDKEEEAALWES